MDVVSRLDDVSLTGLLTAFCHAIASRSAAPLLRDPWAEGISERLAPILANSPSALLRRLAEGRIREDLVVHLAIRARKYDRWAREFLERHGRGCVVNLGCGLDARFWRIDDGRVRFYDLDLPRGDTWPCQCGAPRCRGHVTGNFFSLPEALQREYRPLLADWFVRAHRDRLPAG